MDSTNVWKQAEKAATGAAQKTISLTLLREFEIPLPTLEEQRRIVTKIEGCHHEIIRLETAITANSERIKQTVDAIWNDEAK